MYTKLIELYILNEWILCEFCLNKLFLKIIEKTTLTWKPSFRLVKPGF